MEKFSNIIKRSVDTIITKHKASLQSFQNQFQQLQTHEDLEIEKLSQVQQRHEHNNEVVRAINSEKVLEIDVIQSSYIPKSSELIEEQPTINIVTEHNHNQQEKKENNSHYREILNQKKAILEELKKIDHQIAQIKGQEVDDVNLKRKEKLLDEQKAKQNAKILVKQLKKDRKDLQDKKKREQEKNLLAMQQEEQQYRKKRQQQEFRLKQQKRRQIEERMEEERRKRQQRKLIQKQSNKLLKELKKQDDMLKKKQIIPAQTGQIQQKKKIIQKKVDVNFREIEQHERKYIIMKEQEKNSRKQRGESVNHAGPKYQRNLWMEKIQQEDFKKKEEEKIKQSQRKAQLQKRLKYGQLVKNIFLPKKRQETRTFQDSNIKPTTPDAVMLPKIRESQKRITQSKAMIKFTQQNKPFTTAYQRPPRQQRQVEKKQEEYNEQNVQFQKQKKRREQEMRKQTKDRLKKLQNQSLDLLPKSKPKYENYLGQIKLKPRGENDEWKKIIDDGKLSKQQKYSQMLKKASQMQKKAKIKEQLRKDGDQEAVNLYIGSIQAKLALLQKF